jgi:hypothetical protein
MGDHRNSSSTIQPVVSNIFSLNISDGWGRINNV